MSSYEDHDEDSEVGTVFVGGSRSIASLPLQALQRLRNAVERQHTIVLGDAAGADLLVQRFLVKQGYATVRVFCSGERPRYNAGPWSVQKVPASVENGFAFYAVKDRAMAEAADFGLMIWDGASPGSILNILRLLRAGKMAVLIDVPASETVNFKSMADWDAFLPSLPAQVRAGLRKRATEAEWSGMDREQKRQAVALPGAA